MYFLKQGIGGAINKEQEARGPDCSPQYYLPNSNQLEAAFGIKYRLYSVMENNRNTVLIY